MVFNSKSYHRQKAFWLDRVKGLGTAIVFASLYERQKKAAVSREVLNQIRADLGIGPDEKVMVHGMEFVEEQKT